MMTKTNQKRQLLRAYITELFGMDNITKARESLQQQQIFYGPPDPLNVVSQLLEVNTYIRKVGRGIREGER